MISSIDSIPDSLRQFTPRRHAPPPPPSSRFLNFPNQQQGNQDASSNNFNFLVKQEQHQKGEFPIPQQGLDAGKDDDRDCGRHGLAHRHPSKEGSESLPLPPPPEKDSPRPGGMARPRTFSTDSISSDVSNKDLPPIPPPGSSRSPKDVMVQQLPSHTSAQMEDSASKWDEDHSMKSEAHHEGAGIPKPFASEHSKGTVRFAAQPSFLHDSPAAPHSAVQEAFPISSFNDLDRSLPNSAPPTQSRFGEGGLTRSQSITHAPVQVPRYVRSSLSALPNRLPRSLSGSSDGGSGPPPIVISNTDHPGRPQSASLASPYNIKEFSKFGPERRNTLPASSPFLRQDLEQRKAAQETQAGSPTSPDVPDVSPKTVKTSKFAPGTVPKVALRRSDTLPKFPPDSRKDGSDDGAKPQTGAGKMQEDEEEKVRRLPSNPKVWTPSQVAIYLAHVLRLVPKPLIEDVSKYVTSSGLGGKRFLRLRERDLEEMGINQNWRRIMSSAREKLRREVLAGRIFGVGGTSGSQFDPDLDLMEEGDEEGSNGSGAGVLQVPKDDQIDAAWKNSWRRTKGKKSRGRVKGMAKEFEEEAKILGITVPTQGPGVDEARRKVREGWKERKRALKKARREREKMGEAADNPKEHFDVDMEAEKVAAETGLQKQIQGGEKRHPRSDSILSFSSVSSTGMTSEEETDDEVGLSTASETSDIEDDVDFTTDAKGIPSLVGRPLEGIDYAFGAEAPSENTRIRHVSLGHSSRLSDGSDPSIDDGLSPASARFGHSFSKDVSDLALDAPVPGSAPVEGLPSISRTATPDFTLHSRTSSYQSNLKNHSESGHDPYQKVKIRKGSDGSSIIAGVGISRSPSKSSDIQSRVTQTRGSDTSSLETMTVEEMMELEDWAEDGQKDSEKEGKTTLLGSHGFASGDKVTVKHVGRDGTSEGDQNGVKTFLKSSSSSPSVGRGTLPNRSLKNLFGAMVELDSSQVEEVKQDPSTKPVTSASDIESLFAGDMDDEKKRGSVILIRKSHLRQLETKLSDMERQMEEMSMASRSVAQTPTTTAADADEEDDESMVALIHDGEKTAEEQKQEKGKDAEVREWRLGTKERERSISIDSSSDPGLPTTQKSFVEATPSWVQLGTFAAATSLGIMLIVGENVLKRLR